MKKVLWLVSSLGIVVFLASCASSSEKPAIQPAEDKLTFAFFIPKKQ